MRAMQIKPTLCALAVACFTSPADSELLNGIATVRPSHQSHRASSWDRAGGNADSITGLPPGQSHTMLERASPGRVRHIWMTASSFPGHNTFLRDLVLRMFWDGSKVPSVETPVGDFFGLGHAKTYAFQSLPVVVGDNPAAMNCYWPMPFHKQARIELYNNGPRTIRSIYYHIDYETGPQEASAGLFHAAYRREAELRGQSGERNLSGEENFVILETEGSGQYLGCFLYIDSQVGGWWGEGDDMIFIDHSAKPVINGTGSEDYFNNAWGLRNAFSYPFYGCPLLEKRDDGGLFTSVYRWHVPDPVRFQSHIRVTLEHLWRSTVTNEFTCVAFWYQAQPISQRAALPRGRANWPRAHPVKAPPAPEFELNATELEEALREQGVKVTAHTASGGLRGWLQVEAAARPVRLAIPVPVAGDYAVQVRPFDAGFEGEVKMGFGQESMRVIAPVAGAKARQPWVALGVARAVEEKVILEASGRSFGLQGFKLARQP